MGASFPVCVITGYMTAIREDLLIGFNCHIFLSLKSLEQVHSLNKQISQTGYMNP